MNSQRVSSKGQLSELVIVADSSIWKSDIKDSMVDLFSGPYIILPQPESEFDVVPTTYSPLPILLKESSNILIIGSSSAKESATFRNTQRELNVEFQEGETILKQYQDVWADNQRVHVLFSDDLRSALHGNRTKLKQIVAAQDQAIVESDLLALGHNSEVEEILNSKFGLQARIPATYKISISNDSVLWLRDEQNLYGLNLIFYKSMIQNPSKASLIEARNELTSQYVKSAIEGAYMRVDDSVIPAFYEDDILRGLWKLENDFMGGPFVTYYMSDSKVLIDGFVYAPNEPKRDYMKRVESVIRSLSTH